MGQEMVIAGQFGALPAALAGAHFDPDELGGGIVGGFGVLTYRTSRWRVKYRGEEHMLVNQETGDPLSSVELVVIKSAPHAPSPPAFATATASDAGQAPAIGAIRTGTLRL